jgi:hypothetical protein
MDIQIRTHTGEKPFARTVCPYRAALSEPTITKGWSEQAQGGPFPCTVCDFRATSQGNLKVHVRTHGETPYACVHCDFKAPRKIR